MLPDTRYVVVVTICTHTDDQVVVGHVIPPTGVQAAGTLHHPLLHVQTPGMRQVKVVLVPEPSIPTWTWLQHNNYADNNCLCVEFTPVGCSLFSIQVVLLFACFFIVKKMCFT